MSIHRRQPAHRELPPSEWSENMIASALARQTFQRKAIVITPNCNWTGYECDLLVVEAGLRIIDVEIKISRADLKADGNKDKWWHSKVAGYEPFIFNGRPSGHRAVYEKTAREWPARVWKHYYAMPAEVWHDSLLDALPSPKSGVIALSYSRSQLWAQVVRKATPNRDAAVLTPAQAVDVARLANLRYWDVRTNLERTREILDDLQRQAQNTQTTKGGAIACNE